MKTYEKYLTDNKLNEAAGQNMLWDLIDQRKLSKLLNNFDEQSRKLLDQILDILFYVSFVGMFIARPPMG